MFDQLDPVRKLAGTVIIMRGLPGSGKSKYVQESIRRDESVTVVSADDYFIDPVTGEYLFDPKRLDAAHRWCFHQFVMAATVLKKSTIVVDNTNLTRWQIAPYYQFGRLYVGKVEFVDLSVDFLKFGPHTRIAREHIAACASRNVHGVDLARMTRMAETWEHVHGWWVNAETGLP